MKQAIGLKAKALSPTPRLGSGMGALCGYSHSKATRKPPASRSQAICTPIAREVSSYSLRILFVFPSCSLRILLVFSLFFLVVTCAAPQRCRHSPAEL
jgi:hypothetical protein